MSFFSSPTVEPTTMPPPNPNVPAMETVVPFQSIDLETPIPVVTALKFNETNSSLSEELVGSSNSTTHRYLFNETTDYGPQ